MQQSDCADVPAVHMVPCEGRLIQLWMYYRNGNPDDNHYAHPLDFIPVVDLNLKKVWGRQEGFNTLLQICPTHTNSSDKVADLFGVACMCLLMCCRKLVGAKPRLLL